MGPLALSVTGQGPDAGSGHRPEIDGLRALAIAPVVINHAAPALLPGGFVGVDIFFVISGYLITGIIAAELAAGRFSLTGFWERRLRRIVPALAAMLAVTAAASWAILTPEDFHQFAKALAASALFASNIQYARGTGYFDGEEGTLPLIHTWTLGVEEQFYLLFPLMVLAVWRWRRAALLPLVVLVGAVSLALALWLAPRMPLAAFYLLPTRMWELMLGAGVALLPRPARGEGRWTAAGVVMIFAGLAVIDPDAPAPGLRFLLPTLGTALVLRYGDGETPAGRVLAWRPLAWLGLISFGLYLWHQPVLALMQYLHFGPLPVWVTLAEIAVSIGLGALSYVLIEQPVRRRRVLADQRLLAGFCAAALALPLGVGAAAYARLLLPHSGAEAQRFTGLIPQGALDTRVIPPAGNVRFVLYGDSHAAQYYSAATARFGAGALVAQSACLSAEGLVNIDPATAKGATCKAQAGDLQTLVRERRIPVVIWAQRWDRVLFDAATRAPRGRTADGAGAELLAGLRRTIDRLPPGTRVILMGNSPTAWAAGPAMANGWLRCRAYRNLACPPSYPEHQAESRALNLLLRAFAAADPRVTYVDAAAPLCSEGRCWLVQEGRLNYWDGSHMTRAAADRVMAQIPPAMLAMPAPLP